MGRSKAKAWVGMGMGKNGLECVLCPRPQPGIAIAIALSPHLAPTNFRVHQCTVYKCKDNVSAIALSKCRLKSIVLRNGNLNYGRGNRHRCSERLQIALH